MASFTGPTNSHQPGLGVAELKTVPPRQSPDQARNVGRRRQPSSAASANRNVRPKPHHRNDTQGRGRLTGNKNLVAANQPNKDEKTTQRSSNRRAQKKRSASSSMSRPPRPNRTPSGVLSYQGDKLHRELDRVAKNGKMKYWQENVFASAFTKIRQALLELSARDPTMPITEEEDRARAHAKGAFDRFKLCMEKA
ncbi:hypothetical protein PG999_006833 [Apiospora kogelbergensis]|uniref:Uncharacterized protein n=1 Tax=Apiospora kogelbergensis TaxID=1337665 RepID=A0AAW0QWL3_9PEZI